MFKPLLISSALILSAGSALAASPAADIDQDGRVSKAEFIAAADTRFTAADTDFDGTLTREEGKALHKSKSEDRVRRHFAKTDANGDGVLSEQEVLAEKAARAEKKKERREAMRARIKERLDTDGDGEISEAEKDAAHALREERRAERKAQRDAGKKAGKNDRPRRARTPRADSDGDGVISRAEYEAATEALFVRMDVNGDGFLTEGEGRERQRSKAKGGRR